MVAGYRPKRSHNLSSDLASHLRARSVAPSTYAKYSASFVHWQAWCHKRGVEFFLEDLDTAQTVRLIEQFVIVGYQVGYGSGQGLKSTTIASVLHGIKHFFASRGLDFPSSHPQIRMLLKGIGRFDAPRQHKVPVSIELMETIHSSLHLDRRIDRALWGVLCLALFFLLRRSEIVALHSADFKWFALRAADLIVVDKHGTPTLSPVSADAVVMTLRGSKANQTGSPTVRMLKRSGHAYLCPVFGALLLHSARAGAEPDLPAAMFDTDRATPLCVTSDQVSSAIQRAASSLGEDPQRFGLHSLRAGGATLMYRAGADAMTIQAHGRWSSDCFKIYASLCEESTNSIASNIVSGNRHDTTLR